MMSAAEPWRCKDAATLGIGSPQIFTSRCAVDASEVDPTKVERVIKEFGAFAVAPQEIYATDADIFAPCALGGIINDETIPQLKVENRRSGGANNQLLEARHGDELARLGILYAPDYAANSGGMISGCREITWLGGNEIRGKGRRDLRHAAWHLWPWRKPRAYRPTKPQIVLAESRD
jgi:hypothetical protein